MGTRRYGVTSGTVRKSVGTRLRPVLGMTQNSHEPELDVAFAAWIAAEKADNEDFPIRPLNHGNAGAHLRGGMNRAATGL